MILSVKFIFCFILLLKYYRQITYLRTKYLSYVSRYLFCSIHYNKKLISGEIIVNVLFLLISHVVMKNGFIIKLLVKVKHLAYNIQNKKTLSICVFTFLFLGMYKINNIFGDNVFALCKLYFFIPKCAICYNFGDKII